MDMTDSTTDSDAALIKASRDDPAPFKVVFERHAAAVHGWLRRRIDSDAVCDDLTAETFAQAWQHRRRYRPPESEGARPWLIGIAHNLYRTWAREQRVEDGALRRLRIEQIHERYDDDVRDAAAPNQIASALLASLPEDQRAAVTLRVIENLPYREVAARAGCSTPSARMRVMRGLRQLKRLQANAESQEVAP